MHSANLLEGEIKGSPSFKILIQLYMIFLCRAVLLTRKGSEQIKLESNRLFLGLFIVAIALCLIIAFRFVNIEASAREIKKPKDKGHRRIRAEILEVNLLVAHDIPVTNMEDEQKFDSSLV